ncbi:MAG TPA: hypothetical protein VN520_30875 [Streptomyces sp.]|nr:hypothetical protein [Streptomyces sp.]
MSGIAAAGAAAMVAILLSTRLLDETAPGGGAVAGSAPYTLKAEPSEVATDALVERPRGAVDVVLTYATLDEHAGTLQASGFVAGLIEDGGTCTLTLSQNETVITVESLAGADATTTSCGLLETGTTLAPGTWEARLSYSSASAEGRSGALEVTVR